MQVILQFCLIAILLEEAFSSGVCYYNYYCITLKNHDLKIPDDNPKIRGEKDDASHTWYTYVNWLDKPVGNLTLYYEIRYHVAGSKDWRQYSLAYINIYEQGKLERHDMTKLARKALGLNRPPVQIPGKIRVQRNLFSGDECIGINFGTPWWTRREYFILLNVKDDDQKVFLDGCLIRPEQKKNDTSIG